MAQGVCSPCRRACSGVRLPWPEADGASVGHAASRCVCRCPAHLAAYFVFAQAAKLPAAHSQQCAGVVPATMVAALELASCACMAAAGISILPCGRESAQQRWLAALKRWQAWLALLNALAWWPALFWARQVGVQQTCMQPCVRMWRATSMFMVAAGWEYAAGVAVCMAAVGAADLCIAGCANGCVAVREHEGCSTASQTHVYFQGAVSIDVMVQVHVQQPPKFLDHARTGGSTCSLCLKIRCSPALNLTFSASVYCPL